MNKRSSNEYQKINSILEKPWFCTKPSFKNDLKRKDAKVYFMLKTNSVYLKQLYKIKKKMGCGKVIIYFESLKPQNYVCKKNIGFKKDKVPIQCYYLVTSRSGLLRWIHFYISFFSDRKDLALKDPVKKPMDKLNNFINFYNKIYMTRLPS